MITKNQIESIEKLVGLQIESISYFQANAASIGWSLPTDIRYFVCFGDLQISEQIGATENWLYSPQGEIIFSFPALQANSGFYKNIVFNYVGEHLSTQAVFTGYKIFFK